MASWQDATERAASMAPEAEAAAKGEQLGLPKTIQGHKITLQ